jgi:Holliday junction resolvasome RuvABC endonuclease subunit
MERRNRPCAVRLGRGMTGENENYLGVDVGTSGAIAVVDPLGAVVSVQRLDATQHDVWTWLAAQRVRFGVIEKVNAMPKQGVSSTFKFGTSFGFCQGMLVAAGIRFEFVTPQKWQKALDCRSGGDKNVTKGRAQALFPGVKVIHANADALLIAEFARRTALGLWVEN